MRPWHHAGCRSVLPSPQARRVGGRGPAPRPGDRSQGGGGHRQRPPLGGLSFEAAEIDLPEGSLIALYTDGLIEALDHDIEAGLTRMCHALAQSSASLEATCDTVLEALLPADRPHDDVALLLARTHALGDRQVATWDVTWDVVLPPLP
ncbi:SpoIIE family protein phosphatase [Streptomyces sp. NPDC002896]|uniref:SpoIIE family protein phosphatase n=1 Tax=Streptomyces sp. NPDC002896 TaxID=3154438 RepID=UPI00332AB5C1